MKSASALPIRCIAAALCLTLFATATVWAAPSRPKPKPKAEYVRLYNQAYDEIRDLEFADAQRLLERALDRKSDFAEAHNNLAYTLRKQGESHYDKALDHYNRAIELKPKLAEGYMYRGVLYVQMDNPDAAEADHATLEELDPKLAKELAYVIEHGHEKSPEGFFGVAGKM
ncbi:MAG: tetratricopeptide repeat protein [Planctomycetota bacterium]